MFNCCIYEQNLKHKHNKGEIQHTLDMFIPVFEGLFTKFDGRMADPFTLFIPVSVVFTHKIVKIFLIFHDVCKTCRPTTQVYLQDAMHNVLIKGVQLINHVQIFGREQPPAVRRGTYLHIQNPGRLGPIAYQYNGDSKLVYEKSS